MSKNQEFRTGTGIYTKIGKLMKDDLKGRFEAETTKNKYWRGDAAELLWITEDENGKCRDLRGSIVT